jgi:hypothetical protein
MEQFKMLVRDVDLREIKELIKDEPRLEVTIINEKHIDKEFWEIEVLCPGIFHIYQIGSFNGYKQCRNELHPLIMEQDEMLGEMLEKGTLLMNAYKELEEKLKTIKNGN